MPGQFVGFKTLEYSRAEEARAEREFKLRRCDVAREIILENSKPSSSLWQSVLFQPIPVEWGCHHPVVGAIRV
jgi:hypothetical protein